MRKFVKYQGARLSPGDIVNLNGDGVPYIYEGEEGKTNFFPLCADHVDDLPRFDSCYDFLSGHNKSDEIVNHDYPEKDYSTTNIPVSAFDRIYINPFEELLEGDVVIMNGKKFIKTGGSGTATHVLSAIPIKTIDQSSMFDLTGGSVDFGDPLSGDEFSGILSGGEDSTAMINITPTPTPTPNTASVNPSPTPTPNTTPIPSVTPTPTPTYNQPQTQSGGGGGGYS